MQETCFMPGAEAAGFFCTFFCSTLMVCLVGQWLFGVCCHALTSNMLGFSSPAKKPGLRKALQFEVDLFDSGSEGQNSEAMGASLSSLSNLVGLVAETSEERYRLLDQRDKIMRQGTVLILVFLPFTPFCWGRLLYTLISCRATKSVCFIAHIYFLCIMNSKLFIFEWIPEYFWVYFDSVVLAQNTILLTGRTLAGTRTYLPSLFLSPHQLQGQLSHPK